MAGIDMVQIARIENLIERRGITFVQKMLNTREDRSDTLAGIFASYEALGKYIGTGLTEDILKNAEVKKDKLGKPSIFYNGETYELSISHEGDYAIAIVSGKINQIKIEEEFLKLLPKRPKNSNKSTFGRLGVFAGRRGMAGCAKLVANAAMRAGSGYVYVFTDETSKEILQISLVEEIIDDKQNIFSHKLDAIAMGPGIGYDDEEFVLKIFNFAAENNIKMVLDADGLFYLKKFGNIGIENLTITPHVLEAARLLDVDATKITENKIECAKQISQKYNTNVIIKSDESIICGKKGECFWNPTGNNGLSKAGSGDVLTGTIGAFLANGVDALNATRLGAYFHGLAADYLAAHISKRSILASDIIEAYKYVFLEEDNA